MTDQHEDADFVKAAVAADIEANQPVNEEMAAQIAAHRGVSERVVLARAAALGYARLDGPRLIYHPAPEARIKAALAKLRSGKAPILDAYTAVRTTGGARGLMAWLYLAAMLLLVSFGVFYCANRSPPSPAEAACTEMGGTAVGDECRF